MRMTCLYHFPPGVLFLTCYVTVKDRKRTGTDNCVQTEKEKND